MCLPSSVRLAFHSASDAGIHYVDYARTKKALDSCLLCPQGDDGPPRAAVIAMGTRVYLACTQTEELVPGHCLIVPVQHTLTTLEGDDDAWDEIRVRPMRVSSRSLRTTL